MISRAVHGDHLAVRSASYDLTFDDLAADVLGFRAQVAPGDVVGVSTEDAAVVGAVLVALEGWASAVYLIPSGVRPSDGITIVGPQLGTAATSSVAPTEQTRWVLYTSGTTGEAKEVTHTLASLTRTVSSGRSDGFVWGLLYDPNRMAGLQVLLQGLSSRATVVAPALDEPLARRVEALIEGGVDALSATPTLWRQILQLPVARGWPLRQITLGGEIADQRVLDALAAAYPSSRIVHVFASTETGAAFSVRDGREGFPLDYLREGPRGVRLDIRDGVLHVFSPGVSTAASDGFASTGDIVAIVDDRVLFRGRASGVVNVGGSNVWPEVVESILREHPDVLDAVVTSKPNSMTGNLLVARVVPRPDADHDSMPKQLRAWVRDKAPTTHVPASVSVVEDIQMSRAGKVSR